MALHNGRDDHVVSKVSGKACLMFSIHNLRHNPMGRFLQLAMGRDVVQKRLP